MKKIAILQKNWQHLVLNPGPFRVSPLPYQLSYESKLCGKEDSSNVIKILYPQLCSGHVEIWGNLEAHQGPWGHHKTGIFDLGAKISTGKSQTYPKGYPLIKEGRGLLRAYTVLVAKKGMESKI